MDFKKEGCYLALRKRLFAFLKILYHELFEIMELNLLFLLLCIPVVTIPPVCAAMSKVTLCMVRQKEYSLRKTFWPTFRQSFGKSLLGGGALILGQLCWLWNVVLLPAAGNTYLLYSLSSHYCPGSTFNCGGTIPISSDCHR